MTRATHLLSEFRLNNIGAAGSLILAGNTILLLQRGGNEAEPHTWAIPGGHIEAGETPLQAALRETREEIHIDLTSFNAAQSFIQPIPHGSQQFTTFVYYFQRPLAEWDPALSEESLAYGWFTKPAVYLLPLHPGMPLALGKVGWANTPRAQG